jgi:hypothetical protein
MNIHASEFPYSYGEGGEAPSFKFTPKTELIRLLQFLWFRMYNEAVIKKQLTPSTLAAVLVDPTAQDGCLRWAPSVPSARVRRPLRNNWIDSSAPSLRTAEACNSINTLLLFVLFYLACIKKGMGILRDFSCCNVATTVESFCPVGVNLI